MCTAYKLYQGVIEDVVNGIREAFLDEGVDEQVLQELRILWESKLQSTKAVDISTDNPAGQGAANANSGGNAAAATASQDTNGHSESASKVVPPTTSTSASQAPQQAAPLPPIFPSDPNVQVPIQITMPRLSSDPPGFQRTITIHVPASCIHSNKLQDILSLPAIQATLSLPTEMAATALQSQINQALQNANIEVRGAPSGSDGFVQVDGQAAGDDDFSDDEKLSSSSNQAIQSTSSAQSSVPSKIYPSSSQSMQYMPKPSTYANTQRLAQLDGQNADGGDSSEDEDEDDDDDDDLDDDADDRDDEREKEAEEEGQDEEPLNSDDDVSDAEGSSEKLYDIENVVVCQFDKITRTRNKWKFHLKDGIMNLNGKDYVFQKATGDAEW